MKIFTYYTRADGMNTFNELQLLTLWRRHWQEMGFQPVVLNEYIAQQSPLYKEALPKLMALPTINPPEYELACYLRWLALAAVGGGWLMDYDVFIRPGAKLPTDDISPDALTIFQTPCCPALVHCPAHAAEAFISLASTGQWGVRPMTEHGNRLHTSDQYCFEAMHMKGVPFVQVCDVMKLYSDKGWERAPIIHFAHAVMIPAGKMPRYTHVKDLLNSTRA